MVLETSYILYSSFFSFPILRGVYVTLPLLRLNGKLDLIFTLALRLEQGCDFQNYHSVVEAVNLLIGHS